MAATATPAATPSEAGTIGSPPSAGVGRQRSTTKKFIELGRRATTNGVSDAVAHADDQEWSEAEIMRTVRVIGGAMIGISVLIVVLNEVFALDAITNSSGQFSHVIDQLVSIGGAGLGLLVIGILILAANRVMNFFGGGGF